MRNLAQSICSTVSTQYSDTRTPSPSASIGWAVFPDDGCDFETLLSAADERMLRRKHLPEPAAI